MSTTVTIEITEAMLPHVREYLAYQLGFAANHYAVTIDAYVDPRSPSRFQPATKTREQVAGARERLQEAEDLFEQLGFDGDTELPLTAATLTASPKEIEALVEWMIDSGTDMIGRATLFGDVTRDQSDRWYLAELQAGFAIRDELRNAVIEAVLA